MKTFDKEQISFLPLLDSIALAAPLNLDINKNQYCTNRDENGWFICKTCGEKFAGLCDNGNCVECDYKKKHPNAQKKYCEQCIHFHYHNLYNKNDHTECCCKLHLEGKKRHEWSYLCNDFFKKETAEQIEESGKELVQYALIKEMEKCPKCGSTNIDKLQRITGYLVGTTDRWNSGKLAELNDRVTHIDHGPKDLFGDE